MPGLFDVSGKSVLVAGGTRGVALMIARGFIEAGATVMICSRKPDACKAAALELSTLGTCIPYAADLSTSEGISSLAERAAEFSPSLDVLVNNVSAGWRTPSGGRRPNSAFDQLASINLQPALMLTHQLLPQLGAGATADEPARVINLGTPTWPVIREGDNVSYSWRRAALHMLIRRLAPALAPKHVTVNAIAPGPFPTTMTTCVSGDAKQRETHGFEAPLGRLGEPNDIAGAAIFLASRASAYLTGAVIPVDGGVSAAR